MGQLHVYKNWQLLLSQKMCHPLQTSRILSCSKRVNYSKKSTHRRVSTTSISLKVHDNLSQTLPKSAMIVFFQSFSRLKDLIPQEPGCLLEETLSAGSLPMKDSHDNALNVQSVCSFHDHNLTHKVYNTSHITYEIGYLMCKASLPMKFNYCCTSMVKLAS